MPDQSTHQANQENRDTVIFVHGTFASKPSDEGQEWWQSNGEFRRTILSALGSECAESLRWTGDNTEVTRQAAADRLLKRLRELERDQRSYHLIGHSHGASIIMEALQRSLAQPLTHLRSWTTLGAPFLHYGLDPSYFAFALPLVLSAVILIRFQLPQVWQLIPVSRDAAESLPWHVLAAFGAGSFAFLLLSGFAIYSVCCVGQALFRLRQRREGRHAAWEYYKLRWIPIWSSSDEAINGLRAAVMLAAPVARPPVNDLIWARIRSAIYGTGDSWTLATRVTNTPVTDIPVCPLVDAEVDAELLSHADRLLAQSAGQVRPALALASVESDPLCTLTCSLSRTTDLRLLVHCQYPASIRIAQLVAEAIKQLAPLSALPLRWQQPFAGLNPQGSTVLYRRPSRFLLAAAGAVVFVGAMLFTLTQSTWVLLHPFTHRAIHQDAIPQVNAALPLVAPTLRSALASDICRRLAQHGAPEEAEESLVYISNASDRVARRIDVIAAYDAGGNYSFAQRAATALLADLKQVTPTAESRMLSYWTGLSLLSMLEPHGTKQPIGDSDVEGFLELAAADTASDSHYALTSLMTLWRQLKRCNRTTLGKVLLGQVKAAMPQGASDQSVFNLYDVAEMGAACGDNDLARRAADLLCSYWDANMNTATGAWMSRLVSVLHQLRDERAAKYEQTVSKETTNAELSDYMKCMERRDYDGAFRAIQSSGSHQQRIWNCQKLQEEVARFPMKVYWRSFDPSTGRLDAKTGWSPGQPWRLRPVVNERLAAKCAALMSQNAFAIPAGPERDSAVQGIVRNQFVAAEYLPQHCLRAWRCASWFISDDAELARLAREVALSVQCGESVDKPLADFQRHGTVVVETQARAANEALNGDEQVAGVVDLAAKVTILGFVAQNTREAWEELLNQIDEFRFSTPGVSEAASKALAEDGLQFVERLNVLCDCAVEEGRRSDGILAAAAKIRNPDLRRSVLGAMAKAAARGGHLGLSASICREILNDPSTADESRYVSSAYLDVAIARALSGRFRQSLDELVYLDLSDKLKLAAVILAELEGRGAR